MFPDDVHESLHLQALALHLRPDGAVPRSLRPRRRQVTPAPTAGAFLAPARRSRRPSSMDQEPGTRAPTVARGWRLRVGTADVLAIIYAGAFYLWLLFRTPGTAATQLVGALAFYPLGLAVAWASWSNSRLPDLDRATRLAWRLFAAASLVLFVGGNLGDFLSRLSGTEMEPAWIGSLRVVHSAVLVAACVALPARRFEGRSRTRALLDATLVVLAGLALALYYGLKLWAGTPQLRVDADRCQRPCARLRGVRPRRRRLHPEAGPRQPDRSRVLGPGRDDIRRRQLRARCRDLRPELLDLSPRRHGGRALVRRVGVPVARGASVALRVRTGPRETGAGGRRRRRSRVREPEVLLPGRGRDVPAADRQDLRARPAVSLRARRLDRGDGRPAGGPPDRGVAGERPALRPAACPGGAEFRSLVQRSSDITLVVDPQRHDHVRKPRRRQGLRRRLAGQGRQPPHRRGPRGRPSGGRADPDDRARGPPADLPPAGAAGRVARDRSALDGSSRRPGRRRSRDQLPRHHRRVGTQAAAAPHPEARRGRPSGGRPRARRQQRADDHPRRRRFARPTRFPRARRPPRTSGTSARRSIAPAT